MKHAYYLLAAAAVLGVSMAVPAQAEQAKAKAQTEASAAAEAPTDGNKEGFFDKVGAWFSSDKEADKAANTAPAAGNSETQQPKAKTGTTAKSMKKQPSANDTNPVVGRVITEGGAEMGVRTNAKLGGGAGGSYGNE